MKSEKEKMLAGELYQAFDSELVDMRTNCRLILDKFNYSTPDNMEKRVEILEELFAQKLEGVIIEPTFKCDYGSNIKLGKNVYMNFNCVILDCAKVKIGDNTMLAPNVQLYTPEHPIDYKTRNTYLEYAKPITIGKNCWLGGGVIVLGGVTIGEGSVIGAGSVVTKDIPPNSLAVGNPARVIKQIDNNNQLGD